MEGPAVAGPSFIGDWLLFPSPQRGEEHERRGNDDGLDGRRDGGAAPLDRARAHGGGRSRHDGRPASRRDLRRRSRQHQARRRAAAALVHGVLRRDGRAERARPRRPSQQGHRAAADPDAAPHGRRPPGQDHGPAARRRAGGEEGRGRRHRPQERPLGRHLRADHAPHDRAGRQDASPSTLSTRSIGPPCRPARRRPRRSPRPRATATPGATRSSSPIRSTSATAA